MTKFAPELINCPRTGRACPYLVHCETEAQDVLERTQQDRLDYLDTTASNTVRLAESLGEEREDDWRQDAFKARAEDIGDMLDISWGNKFTAQEEQVSIHRKAAQRARATCFGGPLFLKRYVLFGERADRCVALLGIFDMDLLSK